MATDQGKTSNMNALAIVADALGKRDPAGWADDLPPALHAGRRSAPSRAITGATCSIRCAPDADRTTGPREQGAVFEDVGLWKRAWYFPRAGEDMHAAVARECRAVRAGVGIFDASTLGKIEVVGPDAATFLNRMYINAFGQAGRRPLPLRPAAAARTASSATMA